MAVKAMTLAQGINFAKDLQDMSRFGAAPFFRSAAKYIRDSTKAHWKTHKDPDGAPWKKTAVRPESKIGDFAPIERRNHPGKFVMIKIKTRRGVRKAKQARRKYGPSRKPLKPLYRTAGKYKAKRLFGYLTAAVSGKNRGQQFQISRTGLRFGLLTNQVKWAEKLDEGGTAKKNRYTIRGQKPSDRVPARTLIGLSKKNVVDLKDMYHKSLMKLVAKRAAAARVRFIG